MNESFMYVNAYIVLETNEPKVLYNEKKFLPGSYHTDQR